jgi:hypothetical protein
MKKFKASVHYNDFTGSTAADNADLNSVNNWLHSQGDLNEHLFGVSVNMDVTDITDIVVNVTFLVSDLKGSKDIPSFLQDNQGNIMLREISKKMKLSEFFVLFKQFSFTLSSVDSMEGISYTSLVK